MNNQPVPRAHRNCPSDQRKALAGLGLGPVLRSNTRDNKEGNHRDRMSTEEAEVEVTGMGAVALSGRTCNHAAREEAAYVQCCNSNFVGVLDGGNQEPEAA